MSGAPTVLYDVPGPKARVRNMFLTAAFLVVLVVVGYFVYSKFDKTGQWDAAMWQPFLESSTWTEFLLPGLQVTLTIAALSIALALPVGAVLGISRLSDHWFVRSPAGVVVEFFRAIPVLILMIFANEAYALYTDLESADRVLFAAVTGLVLYNASVLAEVVRAGILSLPRGQAEAASALGMRKTQVMTNVLLPQAVTAMLPAIVSQLVVILKDTALAGGALAVGDLLRSGTNIADNFTNTIPTYIVIGTIYVVLNFALTTFASWLEKRLSRRKKSGGAVVESGMVEEQAPGMPFDTGRAV